MKTPDVDGDFRRFREYSDYGGPRISESYFYKEPNVWAVVFNNYGLSTRVCFQYDKEGVLRKAWLEAFGEDWLMSVVTWKRTTVRERR